MKCSLALRAAQPHVTVIGAGLVGLTSAEALLRRGFRVTVLDRQPGVASECSFANAALLMRSYSRPKTATPGQLLKWASTKSEPVHVSWRALLDPHMTSFGLRFLMSGPQTEAKIYETTQLTDELAALSGECFDAVRTELGLKTGITEGGLLMFFTDAAKLQALVDENRAAYPPEKQQKLFRVVSPQECVELEPALAPRAAELAGGVFWMPDRTICPLAFSRELTDALVAKGAEIRLGEEVTAVEEGAAAGGVSVRTTTGKLDTQAVVLAAGVWSGKLLRAWGVPGSAPVPLYGMRGHSMTLDVEHMAGAEGHVLSRSVCDGDAMAFYSPLPLEPGASPKLRVAAFGDFDGWGFGPGSVRPWRMEQLRRSAAKTFPNLLSPAVKAGLEQPAASGTALDGLCSDTDAATRWCGLRPMSPDGLPLVGRVTSRAPFFLNAGHGALGWSLSSGCAEIVASSVEAELRGGGAPAASSRLMQHLDPQRFRWSRVLQGARSQWLGGGGAAAGERPEARGLLLAGLAEAEHVVLLALLRLQERRATSTLSALLHEVRLLREAGGPAAAWEEEHCCAAFDRLLRLGLVELCGPPGDAAKRYVPCRSLVHSAYAGFARELQAAGPASSCNPLRELPLPVQQWAVRQ